MALHVGREKMADQTPKEIKRYRCATDHAASGSSHGVMLPYSDGRWVDYNDHLFCCSSAVLAERERCARVAEAAMSLSYTAGAWGTQTKLVGDIAAAIREGK